MFDRIITLEERRRIYAANVTRAARYGLSWEPGTSVEAFLKDVLVVDGQNPLNEYPCQAIAASHDLINSWNAMRKAEGLPGYKG